MDHRRCGQRKDIKYLRIVLLIIIMRGNVQYNIVYFSHEYMNITKYHIIRITILFEYFSLEKDGKMYLNIKKNSLLKNTDYARLYK